MASALVLRRALEISKEQLSAYESWLEECEEYRRPALGAPNGYRPHYCEHGTDRWTDFDNICGGCEDGVSMGRGTDRREFALGQARWQFDGRRRHHDLPMAEWGQLSEVKVKGRAILQYLLTLPENVRDSVKLDKDENRCYFSYLRWLIEQVH